MLVLDLMKNNSDWETILRDSHGIITKRDPLFPELVCLCYDQIACKKTDPIAIECRGLVIDVEKMEVVSRPFDRFFNYGEVKDITSKVDYRNSVGFEKLDGSLVTFYWNETQGQWMMSTKSTPTGRNAFVKYADYVTTLPILAANALGFTRKDYTFSYRQEFMHHEDYEEILDFFTKKFHSLDKSLTYICELVSPYNRVVTFYDDIKLYLLGTRNTSSGEEVETLECDLFEYPEVFHFSDEEEMKDIIQNLQNELGNIREGMVVHDKNSGVRVKVKSTLYLMAHRTNGKELDTKSIINLVCENEEQEFLAYSNERQDKFEKYITARQDIISSIDSILSKAYDMEQKDIANEAKALGVASFIFPALKKNVTSAEVAFSMASLKLRFQTIEKKAS